MSKFGVSYPKMGEDNFFQSIYPAGSGPWVNGVLKCPQFVVCQVEPGLFPFVLEHSMKDWIIIKLRERNWGYIAEEVAPPGSSVCSFILLNTTIAGHPTESYEFAHVKQH